MKNYMCDHLPHNDYIVIIYWLHVHETLTWGSQQQPFLRHVSALISGYPMIKKWLSMTQKHAQSIPRIWEIRWTTYTNSGSSFQCAFPQIIQYAHWWLVFYRSPYISDWMVIEKSTLTACLDLKVRSYNFWLRTTSSRPSFRCKDTGSIHVLQTGFI